MTSLKIDPQKEYSAKEVVSLTDITKTSLRKKIISGLIKSHMGKIAINTLDAYGNPKTTYTSGYVIKGVDLIKYLENK